LKPDFLEKYVVEQLKSKAIIHAAHQQRYRPRLRHIETPAPTPASRRASLAVLAAGPIGQSPDAVLGAQVFDDAKRGIIARSFLRARGGGGTAITSAPPSPSSCFEPEPCSCAFNGRLTADACTQLLTTSETAHRSPDLQGNLNLPSRGWLRLVWRSRHMDLTSGLCLLVWSSTETPSTTTQATNVCFCF
jgi:hypothetical protein